MNKRVVRILSVLLLVVVVLAIAIYKRPMTIEQLYPGIELKDCKSIKAFSYADYAGAEPNSEPVIYPAGSEEFEAIVNRLQGRTFRKSLRNLLPSGTKQHIAAPGDFQWELILTFDDTLLPDGTTGRGDIVHFRNFYGTLEYYDMNGNTIRCNTAGQAQWLENIMAILSASTD